MSKGRVAAAPPFSPASTRRGQPVQPFWPTLCHDLSLLDGSDRRYRRRGGCRLGNCRPLAERAVGRLFGRAAGRHVLWPAAVENRTGPTAAHHRPAAHGALGRAIRRLAALGLGQGKTAGQAGDRPARVYRLDGPQHVRCRLAGEQLSGGRLADYLLPDAGRNVLDCPASELFRTRDAGPVRLLRPVRHLSGADLAGRVFQALGTGLSAVHRHDRGGAGCGVRRPGPRAASESHRQRHPADHLPGQRAFVVATARPPGTIDPPAAHAAAAGRHRLQPDPQRVDGRPVRAGAGRRAGVALELAMAALGRRRAGPRVGNRPGVGKPFVLQTR